MKLSIISDTHFGDPNCTLVAKNGENYTIGPKYQDLKTKIGNNNHYLVLIGDIFDCSIECYQKIFEAAKVFFQQIKQDGLAKEIIYIPGNHDFNLWVTLEEQMNVINQMNKEKTPRPFHYSLPGVFDDRITDDNKKFFIPGVKRKTSTGKYGDLFLDSLTDGDIPFNVVYPNLYFIDKQGESFIITHGHYLDVYWSFLGNLILEIADNELDNEIKGKLKIKELVATNLPLNQLASSCIGQADIFTDLVRLIQREIKDNKFRRVKKYLDRIDNIIDKQLKFKLGKFDPQEWCTDAISNEIKKTALKKLKEAKAIRFNKAFITDKDVRKRFREYFLACLIELEELRKEYSIEISRPDNFIFGHTHQPIAFLDNKTKMMIHDKIVYLHNTGGWLIKENEDGENEFCGAEVFIYDENGMRSERID